MYVQAEKKSKKKGELPHLANFKRLMT